MTYAGLVQSLSPLLTGKQRNALRKLGHSLKPVVQVGQKGISENLLKNIDQALLDHELIKVRLVPTSDDDYTAVATAIHEATGAQLAQKVGRNLLFYRAHPEEPKITV